MTHTQLLSVFTDQISLRTRYINIMALMMSVILAIIIHEGLEKLTCKLFR